jgi:tetratricopeptide (TPR) repeat protein
MSNISNIYASKRQFQTALDYVILAKNIREKRGIQNTVGYGFNLLNLGTIYESMGKKDLAGRHYRMAYDVYDKVGYNGYEKKQALDSAKRLGH